ncbi:hypothetical protein ACFWPV_16610 [Streptomyces uncialis]|uniref:hypothetical protein n=1 Tax=Streptomyces uncialis TaxID=1048205 RepID=UPI00365FF748
MSEHRPPAHVIERQRLLSPWGKVKRSSELVTALSQPADPTRLNQQVPSKLVTIREAVDRMPASKLVNKRCRKK